MGSPPTNQRPEDSALCTRHVDNKEHYKMATRLYVES